MKRSFLTLTVLFSLLVACSFAFEAEHVEGQVLVRFKPEVNSLKSAQSGLDSSSYVVQRELVPELNLFLVQVKGQKTARQAVQELSSRQDVVYAQLDHVVTLRDKFPDDPDFKNQWSLMNNNTHADIRAPDAWEIGTGGKDDEGNDIVIAIVDGGSDLAHSDLKDNYWVNSEEIPDNGVDDDENGYIDDINGWNAFYNNGKLPAASHGTHVSGIAGARGNNHNGIAGINWNTKLMIVAAASSSTSVISIGYGYVLKQKKLWIQTKGKKGANVVITNSSFGVDYANCSSGSYPVWNDLYNAMGEVGILSAAATINAHVDVDVRGDVPTGCSSPYLVKVTNTDSQDKKYQSAGYGLRTIDLGAPGTGIYSTLPSSRYGGMTGTSMATPHVAGAVALLHSVAGPEFSKLRKEDPAKASLLLKSILVENVDPLSSLKGITISGGRLNLAKAAKAIASK